jgi:uncharacterized protein YkwD
MGFTSLGLCVALTSCVSFQGQGDTLPSQVDEPGDGDDLFPDGGGADDGGGIPDDDAGGDDGAAPDDGDVGDPADDMDDQQPQAGEVPDNAYCTSVADWSDEWSAFEEDVLRLVNERRAVGASCGSQGSFQATSALSMNAALRCAARVHSADMAARQYFDHTNPEGENPGDRLSQAGYAASTWGENIAFGYGSPEAVVDGWMQSDGHCANIMRPGFTEIGVGYATGNMWTQVFGAP